MKYWDSSALVPLLVEEPATGFLTRLYQDDPVMLAWWGAEVECASALACLEREGAISAAGTAAALKRLKALKTGWNEVQPGDAVKEIALRLLRLHHLRAADSLQLAAAVLVAEHRPSTLDFVCLDERLTMAAQREGFNVISGMQA